MKELNISREFNDARIDSLCEKILVNAGKSFIYKMFRKKNIVLNGKKINGKERVKEGDSIKFFFSDETYKKFTKIEKILSCKSLNTNRIVYEDENILVYNKPKQVLSQPDGAKENLVDEYAKYIKTEEISSGGIRSRYGVCNRLDFNTSGISIIGKNANALKNINEAIRNKTVVKEYYAILNGVLDKPKKIEGYLNKNSFINKVQVMNKEEAENTTASYICTKIEPLETNKENNISFVKIILITGKTHQIRAHLASINHSIIGDMKYGDRQINAKFKKDGVDTQLLHSYRYMITKINELEYLINKEFLATVSNDMQKVLDKYFGQVD